MRITITLKKIKIEFKKKKHPHLKRQKMQWSPLTWFTKERRSSTSVDSGSWQAISPAVFIYLLCVCGVYTE